MNKKIRIGVLLTLFAVVLGFTVHFTYAWLTDQKEISNTTFTLGEVKYEVSGDLSSETILVPGDSLLAVGTTIGFTNASSVTSQIRATVKYAFTTDETVDESTATTPIDDTANVTGLTATSGSGNANLILAEMGTGWEYNTDGYWYYGGTEGEIPSNTETYSFIEGLIINGHVVGNAYANQKLVVVITLQCKQAEHVTWSDLGTVSFTTGI